MSSSKKSAGSTASVSYGTDAERAPARVLHLQPRCDHATAPAEGLADEVDWSATAHDLVHIDHLIVAASALSTSAPKSVPSVLIGITGRMTDVIERLLRTVPAFEAEWRRIEDQEAQHG